MASGGQRHRAGRKPDPTDKKVIQGTFRKDRHADEAQPAAKGWPDAPAHLSARERALWDALRAHCERWSAQSDWLAFSAVVSLADRLLRVQEALLQEETVESATSLRLQRMEIALWRELRGYIGLCGLSPADRARMRVTDTTDRPTNPLDRFIKRKPPA